MGTKVEQKKTKQKNNTLRSDQVPTKYRLQFEKRSAWKLSDQNFTYSRHSKTSLSSGLYVSNIRGACNKHCQEFGFEPSWMLWSNADLHEAETYIQFAKKQTINPGSPANHTSTLTGRNTAAKAKLIDSASSADLFIYLSADKQTVVIFLITDASTCALWLETGYDYLHRARS